MKKAYLFPGQGSQFAGMGREHYQFSEIFRSRCDQAAEQLGFSITDVMFGDAADKLNQTRYTQPALFVHAYARFEMLGGHIPDMVAGHSLGEYTALAVVGAISFEEGLNAVGIRGELMQQAGDEHPGAMAAVIGLEDDVVTAVCDRISSKEGQLVIPANFNTRGQVVISGSVESVDEAMEALKAQGARMVKKLPVSGAFHSPLMESAQRKLDAVIDDMAFNKPAAPVYSNASATASDDPQILRSLLRKQLLSPVYWTRTLENMRKEQALHFIEVGPGNVLQGLVKRTLKDIECSGFS